MKVHLVQKFKMLILACLSFCLLFPLTAFAETDVTDLVEITQSRLRYDRRAGTSSTNVSIQNISDEVLLTPIKVVIDSISSTDVTVANADGMTDDGKPYFEYDKTDKQLQPEDFLGSKTIAFANPNRNRFTFSLSILSSDKAILEFQETKLFTTDSGGSLELLDGTIISIPPAALPFDTQITVNVNKSVDNNGNYGFLLDFQPAGLIFDKSIIITFQKPLILNEKFVLKAFMFSDENEPVATGEDYSKFKELNIYTDTENYFVEINHFSSLSIWGVQAFYNVFSPSSEETRNRYLKMGDIEYSLSTTNVDTEDERTGWCPGHARAYLGINCGSSSKDGRLTDDQKEEIKTKIDNLKESDLQAFKYGTYVHSISKEKEFGSWQYPGVWLTPNDSDDNDSDGHREIDQDRWTYLGAKRRQNLSWQDRLDIAKFLIDKEGVKYHWIFNTDSDFEGTLVDEEGYSCVGLIEAAYESINKGLVLDIPFVNAVLPARQIISSKLEDINEITVPEGTIVDFDIYGVLLDVGIVAPTLESDSRADGKYVYNDETYNFSMGTTNMASTEPYEFTFHYVYEKVYDLLGLTWTTEYTSDRTLKIYVIKDVDDDGIIDSDDNCYKYNPEQIDADGDGVGDACEEGDKIFFDDFNDGDYDGWEFYSFTTGLHGEVRSPQVIDDRLHIYTRDQQSTMLINGDKAWSDYTVEADVTVERAYDDVGRAFTVDFYINNFDTDNPNQIFSRDSFAFGVVARDQVWRFNRVYKTDTGSTSEVLSSGRIPNIINGTTYVIKAAVSGDNVDLYLFEKGQPEVLLDSVDISGYDLTSGRFGFGGGDAEITIDNVNVYPIP